MDEDGISDELEADATELLQEEEEDYEDSYDTAWVEANAGETGAKRQRDATYNQDLRTVPITGAPQLQPT